MECPKCRKNAPDDAYDCPLCGTKIRERQDGRKSKRRLFKREKKRKDKRSDPARMPDPEAEGEKKIRLRVKAKKEISEKLGYTALGVSAAVIIVVIAVLLSALLTQDGEKYAESAAEFIGRDVAKFQNDTNIHLSESSAFDAVNEAVSFDYIYESEDRLRAGGKSYPEWAVFVKVSSYNYITDVVYTDFTRIKKDMRGKKIDAEITLDRFAKGDKRTSVLKYIDLDPYSISRSETGAVTYTFKYYFERSNGDEQAALLRAVFDEDDRYQYCTNELLIDKNL